MTMIPLEASWRTGDSGQKISGQLMRMRGAEHSDYLPELRLVEILRGRKILKQSDLDRPYFDLAVAILVQALVDARKGDEGAAEWLRSDGAGLAELVGVSEAELACWPQYTGRQIFRRQINAMSAAAIREYNTAWWRAKRARLRWEREQEHLVS